MNRILIHGLFLVPHHLVSRAVFWLTRRRSPLTPWVIRRFCAHFGVDLSDAVITEPADYATFNAFFTRRLRPGARPLSPGNDTIVSPVDGTISQIGPVTGGRILQAKGHTYTVAEVLGGFENWVRHFEEGAFSTIYLSPRDYHRIHMPLTGTLREMIYVPGRLFSVAPATVRSVPRLFARNERVVSLFETEQGPLAVILVGAINVAAIETVWSGLVTPPHRGEVKRTVYDGSLTLNKGDELGCFNMGSTVIVLFSTRCVAWAGGLGPETPVKLGQLLARPSSEPMRDGRDPTEPDAG